MGWHATRVQWNAEGLCAREACRADMGESPWWNTSTRLFYCTSCAHRINRANADVVPSGLCVPRWRIYLTNAASRKPPQRGPGKAWTIMAAPRGHYGETGDGVVPLLVPELVWVQRAKSGEWSMELYRDVYRGQLEGELKHLAPRQLKTGTNRAVRGGDTLLCCCSRAAAAAGECHRAWAAALLRDAGWTVVLDGEAL